MPQIQKEGLAPGKETVLSPVVYWMLMEAGKPLPDPKCFYAWESIEKAKQGAYATSALADDKYQGDDRKPVVIEFDIKIG